LLGLSSDTASSKHLLPTSECLNRLD
jgi:hypothetical protein